jgi:hypothetical protein
METYFVKYKATQTKEPYELPEKLQKALTTEGVKINHQSSFEPIVIVEIPDDKVDKIKSLDDVVGVYTNIKV